MASAARQPESPDWPSAVICANRLAKAPSSNILQASRPDCSPLTSSRSCDVRRWSKGAYSSGLRRSRLLSCREVAKTARLGFGGFGFAVLGRGRGFERRDEAGGNGSDFVDRVLERGFVGFRRLGESADLTDELERGSADLGFGYRRVEVEQRPDIAAHGVKVAEYRAVTI